MNTTNQDLERYELARELAGNSECRFKMGAVIFRHKPIATGINVIKTHPDHKRYGKHVISIHAEHRAILRSRTSVNGATLYVARDGGDTSKPCPACMAYMREAGIYAVVYLDKGTVVKERL
jgi:deoxycytidylate deaminase